MDVSMKGGTLKRLQRHLKRAQKAAARYTTRSEEGVKFYFDDQWEEKAKSDVEGRNQPVVTNNRIKPVVRVVLGMMLSRPLDWLAKPVGLSDDDLSEAATASLKYVANRSKLRHILKQVYFDALTYGVGWCQVGPYVRVNDKRREIVQHRWIDPREVFPDPQSREPDGSDLRWLIWRRKVDRDDFQNKYGKKMQAALERGGLAVAGEEKGDQDVTVHPGPSGTTPAPGDWNTFDSWNLLDKEQGDDSGTKQILVYEVWETVQEQVWMVERADGQPTEIPDPVTTEEGAAAIADPSVVTYYQSEVPKVWRHVFSGDILLESERSKHKHDRIPFVSCYYERDHNGDPVSFIETLKDMQREVNYRRSKMLHELGGPQVVADPEVLSHLGMTVDEAAKHASKPGAFWPVAPGAIAYLDRGAMASQQFQLMMHGEESIQKNAGTNDHLMGYDGPAESGKSKEISLAQGSSAQRDAEENLLTFHQVLGELTLSDIQTWHTGPWVVRITDDVGKDKFITVNEQQVDPTTGQVRIVRDINAAPMEIEIDSMPWTVTLRQRAFQSINEMANQEQDPILRMAYRRIAFTVGDIPERAKILEILTGAEQQSQQAQAAQVQQQQAQQQAQLQQEAMMAQMKQGGAPMPVEVPLMT